jgi:hypothetical protein
MKHVNLSVTVLSLLMLSACATKGPDRSGKGTASFSAEKLQRQITQDNVTALISQWPEASRAAVAKTIDKYGLPDGMTDELMVWSDAGHFKRILVYREEVPHNFPMEHKDVLQQFVSYEIPAGKADDVLRFTGSVILDRTAGEMSARCDREEMNVVALNLADQVLQGQMPPEQARLEYGQAALALRRGESHRLASALTFTQPEDSGDPDESFRMRRQAEEEGPDAQAQEQQQDLGETDEGVPMRMQRVPQDRQMLEMQDEGHFRPADEED